MVLISSNINFDIPHEYCDIFQNEQVQEIVLENELEFFQFMKFVKTIKEQRNSNSDKKQEIPTDKNNNKRRIYSEFDIGKDEMIRSSNLVDDDILTDSIMTLYPNSYDSIQQEDGKQETIERLSCGEMRNQINQDQQTPQTSCKKTPIEKKVENIDGTRGYDPCDTFNALGNRFADRNFKPDFYPTFSLDDYSGEGVGEDGALGFAPLEKCAIHDYTTNIYEEEIMKCSIEGKITEEEERLYEIEIMECG